MAASVVVTLKMDAGQLKMVERALTHYGSEGLLPMIRNADPADMHAARAEYVRLGDLQEQLGFERVRPLARAKA